RAAACRQVVEEFQSFDAGFERDVYRAALPAVADAAKVAAIAALRGAHHGQCGVAGTAGATAAGTGVVAGIAADDAGVEEVDATGCGAEIDGAARAAAIARARAAATAAECSCRAAGSTCGIQCLVVHIDVAGGGADGDRATIAA